MSVTTPVIIFPPFITDTLTPIIGSPLRSSVTIPFISPACVVGEMTIVLSFIVAESPVFFRHCFTASSTSMSFTLMLTGGMFAMSSSL